MRVVEKILKYLLVIAILVASIADYGDAFAQRRKRSRTRKDAVQIKAPSIRRKKQARQIKSTKKRRAEAPRANGRSKAPRRVYYRQFMPTKEPAMVSEVQDSLNDAETNVVEVEEQVRMDCTWVKVTEYYSLWDSRRVNPYGVDKKTIQDTATITLFDTSMGAGYHVPVNQTFVTSRFGARGGRFHYGADLELDIGDSIFAVWDGIVRITSFDARGYGYYVLVRHYNGLETLYGHLSNINTDVGQLVKAGDLIGFGGNTGRSSGPHLHFEVRYQGNAIDPSQIFNFPASQIIADQFVLAPDKFDYVTRAARKVLYHRVRSGDTMYSVASRYGLTVSQLARINAMSARTRLRSGRRLRIK